MERDPHSYIPDQGPATQWQADELTRLVHDLGVRQILGLMLAEARLHGSKREIAVLSDAVWKIDPEVARRNQS